MNRKPTRQEAIEILLQKELIYDQQALVDLLGKKYAIICTQAAVSRDLKALGVIKKRSEAGDYYAMPSQEVEKEILRRAVKKINYNQCMILVHTYAGMADFVGDQLDQADLNLLGCLSGENVVFVAPKDVHEIPALVKQLAKYFNIDNS